VGTPNSASWHPNANGHALTAEVLAANYLELFVRAVQQLDKAMPGVTLQQLKVRKLSVYRDRSALQHVVKCCANCTLTSHDLRWKLVLLMCNTSTVCIYYDLECTVQCYARIVPLWWAFTEPLSVWCSNMLTPLLCAYHSCWKCTQDKKVQQQLALKLELGDAPSVDTPLSERMPLPTPSYCKTVYCTNAGELYE
jgi:hypothetical protein